MNIADKFDKWIKEHTTLLFTGVLAAVYYLAKSYTQYGFSIDRVEVLIFFLLYEFTTLKQILLDIKSVHCLYYLYTRIQRDKQFGSLTNEEILKHIMEHEND